MSFGNAILRALRGLRSISGICGLSAATAMMIVGIHTPATAQSSSGEPRHKVIYDADFGVDDAMGLIFLSRSREVELLGVTTVFGNAFIDNTTKNALFLKDYLGFAAPVAQGAAKPLVGPAGEPPKLHGANGLGNYAVPAARSKVDARPASQFIIDTVRENPGEVTIISVGRLTNLALAMSQDPELPKLVKQVIVMGGAFGYNYGGQRSGQNPFNVAEANISGDARASDEVMNAGWPLTLVPLDVTIRTIMDKAFLDALPGKDGELIRAISGPTYVTPQGSTPVHDSSAIFYALRPDAYKTVDGIIRVATDGPTVGQTSVGKPTSNNPAYQGRQVNKVTVEVDTEAVLKLYHSTLAAQ